MGNMLIEHGDNTQWLKTHAEKRLEYIKETIKPLPSYCPECHSNLTTSINEDETICTHCGLIVSASIEYTAGIRINLPYGRQP